MSSHASTGLYAEDLYCSNPDNLIASELQTVQTPGFHDYYFIIPHASPYYVETLEVRHQQSGQLFVEGVDYLVGHYFVDAMRSLKRPIAGSIRFLRRNIIGTVSLRYHTVGGQWGFSANVVLEELAAKQVNPIVRSWEQIDVMPQKFPTIDHDQPVDQLVGSEDIVEAIDRIGGILEATASGTSESHITDRNNPHQVTQTQVGLGLVQNYAPATPEQALNKLIGNAYITPATMHHALDHVVFTVLNGHINNRDNPHGTTKAHVGLSQVPNFPMADAVQAVDPLNNVTFMSPYTTALMVQSLIPTDSIDSLADILYAFMARRDNPHEITPAQIGTLTEEEIQQLMVTAGTGDAITFNGYNMDQFMTMVVTPEENIDIMDGLMEEFNVDYIGLVNIDPQYQSDLDDRANEHDLNTVVDFVTGIGGYAVALTNGSGYHKSLLPDLNNHPVDYVGTTMAFQENGVYGIAASGGVSLLRGDGPPVAKEYDANHAGYNVNNVVTAIFATRTARWLLIEDGRLVRSDGPDNAVQIDSDVEELWTNLEYSKPGEMVLYGKDDLLYAAGNDSFIRVFDSFKSMNRVLLDGIDEVALTDDSILLLKEGVAYQVEILRNPNTNTVTGLSPPSVVSYEASSISGNGAHSLVLELDGTVKFYGTLENGEETLDHRCLDAVCGGGYTLLQYDDESIVFWGDSPGNELVFDSRMVR